MPVGDSFPSSPSGSATGSLYIYQPSIKCGARLTDCWVEQFTVVCRYTHNTVSKWITSCANNVFYIQGGPKKRGHRRWPLMFHKVVQQHMQGAVGFLKYPLTANLPKNLPVTNICKSVNIWQNYDKCKIIKKDISIGICRNISWLPRWLNGWKTLPH